LLHRDGHRGSRRLGRDDHRGWRGQPSSALLQLEDRPIEELHRVLGELFSRALWTGEGELRAVFDRVTDANGDLVQQAVAVAPTNDDAEIGGAERVRVEALRGDAFDRAAD